METGMETGMERILVSGCLLGRPVRYDGRAKERDDRLLARWRTEGRLVPVCPEVDGGLPVPRPPAEIEGGHGGEAVIDGRARVLTAEGTDVTGYFVRGARLAVQTARRYDVRVAVLKESSPSCGSRHIYDGTFAGRALPGLGVTTALLRRFGIAVFAEDELGRVAEHVRELERSA